MPEHETISWLLFANLSFFGVIVSQQLGSIFSNMLSFAMGGAEDLGVKNAVTVRDYSDGPNWGAFARAYGTLRWLQVGTAFTNLLLAGAMGYYALGNLLDGVSHPEAVIGAFIIILVTGFISTSLGNYETALRGMNKVALENRWQTIMSLISVAVGVISLVLGGGIFWTTLVMQMVIMCNVLRMRYLAFRAEDGAIQKFPQLLFDREIFVAAWGPMWRQGLVAFAAVGFVQGIGVIFSFTGTAAEVGSYFLLIRIWSAVNLFSHAPFSSVAPRFSREIARGQIAAVRDEILLRFRASLSLFVVGMFGIVFVAPWLLQFIGANLLLPDFYTTALYCCFGCYAKYFSLAQHVLMLGNVVIQYWERLLVGLLGIFLVSYLMPKYGNFGIVLGIVAPYPFVFRLVAIRQASDFLGIKQVRLLREGIISVIYLVCTFSWGLVMFIRN
ncbi:hypothetical protein QEH59_02575 [Coraliomargarita sp. SDUM461004]|uniref:Polysaccharide biosynthesis protein n=1 Tax=Thalassobacterium sedimentorum TaxID=3041258 RepID=A0ABU1AGJ9_9BACT|nr:hypothetical protein [Coraliomargarita sp. SDUM461004]MDQ8193293.1 hypothetical protein [Coraliomargarita sp. SDUM461004]